MTTDTMTATDTNRRIGAVKKTPHVSSSVENAVRCCQPSVGGSARRVSSGLGERFWREATGMNGSLSPLPVIQPVHIVTWEVTSAYSVLYPFSDTALKGRHR